MQLVAALVAFVFGPRKAEAGEALAQGDVMLDDYVKGTLMVSHTGELVFLKRTQRRGYVEAEFLPVSLDCVRVLSREARLVQMSEGAACISNGQVKIVVSHERVCPSARPGPWVEDLDEACLAYWEDAHGGPGWYYWWADYPDEGSCGPYPTEGAALAEVPLGTQVLGLSEPPLTKIEASGEFWVRIRGRRSLVEATAAQAKTEPHFWSSTDRWSP